MRKNGWKLLLVLLCIAFLVSCAKKEEPDREKANLVKLEAEGEYPFSLFSHNMYGGNTMTGIHFYPEKIDRRR